MYVFSPSLRYSLRNLYDAMMRFAPIMLLFLLSLTACRQNRADVDPQYLGLYEPVQYSESIQAEPGPVISNFQSRGSITVATGTERGTITLAVAFPNTTETLTARVSGTQFTITSKTQEDLTVRNSRLRGDYTGTGEFTTDGSLIVRISVRATQNATTYVKTASFAGNKRS